MQLSVVTGLVTCSLLLAVLLSTKTAVFTDPVQRIYGSGDENPTIRGDISEEIPTIPGDNSHYVEGKSRYIWMTDRTGTPILQDLQIPINAPVIKAAEHGKNNQYWLFTRQNPVNHQLLVHGNANSVWNSNYNGNLPTKILVHGWNSDGNSTMNILITSAFLAVLDCNIIVVDWRDLAGNIIYPASVAGVPSVGQYLGDFLLWLLDTTGGNWNNVHLVGFSLGAHVVGNAGRTALGRPARVTGLDPAGPRWAGNSNALNKNDGKYVEAIHTDGGILGLFEKIGDADFYPNGGRSPQPGCWFDICSHRRSYELFAATIHHNHLVGCACLKPYTNTNETNEINETNETKSDPCTGLTLHMGNAIINKTGSGMFCLETDSEWPF